MHGDDIWVIYLSIVTVTEMIVWHVPVCQSGIPGLGWKETGEIALRYSESDTKKICTNRSGPSQHHLIKWVNIWQNNERTNSGGTKLRLMKESKLSLIRLGTGSLFMSGGVKLWKIFIYYWFSFYLCIFLCRLGYQQRRYLVNNCWHHRSTLLSNDIVTAVERSFQWILFPVLLKKVTFWPDRYVSVRRTLKLFLQTCRRHQVFLLFRPSMELLLTEKIIDKDTQ